MNNKNDYVIEKLRKNFKHVKTQTTQNKSRNIIAYCRVSDAHKQGDNYSISTQLNCIKRYAEQNNLNIVKIYKILGESSKKGSKRKSIRELLEFIINTKLKIHEITVFHTNRFARDGKFGGEFLDKIIPKGIGFRDLNSQNDIFTQEGKIRQVNAFYDAEQDNITRTKFINAVTLEKLMQGYTMRKPPKGYKLFKSDKRKRKQQKVVITKEGELIRQAFRLKIDYNYSNVMIVEIMNPRGLKITDKALGLIFKNPYYCGIIKDRRLLDYNGYVEGLHPKMITPDEYDIINSSKGKRRQIKRKEIEQLPLRRYLICSNCNQKFTGYKATNRKNLFYYKCSTKGCGVNIKKEIIHDLYIEKLKTLSFNRSYLPQLKSMLDGVFKNINQSNIKLKRDINTSITELEGERFLAIRNMNAHPESRDVYSELIEYCNKDLIDLQEQLGQIRIGIDEVKKQVFESLKFVNDLSSIWSRCDFVYKIKLQELIFPDGIWYDKTSNNLVAPKTNPIFNIINDLSGFLSENSRNFDTSKVKDGNLEFIEKSNNSRTSDFPENMLITPSIIGSYECRNEMLGGEKIPLVVLLSDTSNNFTNDLIDSMTELISFIDLYTIVINIGKK